MLHTCSKQVQTFFHARPHCFPFITPESIRKPYVFCWLREYRKKLLTWNGFIICILIYIYYSVIHRVFQIALRGRGEISPPEWGGSMMRNFAREEGNFFTSWWKSEEWFWLFQLFSKLKATFCKYWISIKIKISMTCHSEHPPSPPKNFFWGIEPRTQFSERGGLTGSQFLEGVALFRGFAVFT